MAFRLLLPVSLVVRRFTAIANIATGSAGNLLAAHSAVTTCRDRHCHCNKRTRRVPAARPFQGASHVFPTRILGRAPRDIKCIDVCVRTHPFPIMFVAMGPLDAVTSRSKAPNAAAARNSDLPTPFTGYRAIPAGGTNFKAGLN